MRLELCVLCVMTEGDLSDEEGYSRTLSDNRKSNVLSYIIPQNLLNIRKPHIIPLNINDVFTRNFLLSITGLLLSSDVCIFFGLACFFIVDGCEFT